MRIKLRIGLVTAASLACLLSCGGEDDSSSEGQAGAEMTARSGPAGCYISAEMSCACDIAEEDCTEEGSQVWADGCASCAD